MKKPISIKLDEKLWVYIKDKPNKSRYIEELIKQDLQGQQVKPIVSAVRDRLLEDESFFREIGDRVKTPKSVSDIVRPSAQDERVLREVSKFTPKPPDPTTGYPCCQKASPCKHWKFIDLEEHWVNELTGEIKEA